MKAAVSALVFGCWALVSAAENNSPFGVCSHITRDEDVDAVLARCVEAGIRNVRADFGWYMFQNKPDEWKASRFTNLLAKARAAGVTVLPVTVGGCDFCSPTFGRADCYQKFGRFIGRMVAEFKGDFPVVEIWNEENCAGFWPPGPNAAHYAATLRETCQAAKKANPNVRIAFGGTSGADVHFYGQAYDNGAKANFDIVNIHPYCMPNAPEGWLERQIGLMRETMAKYGDSEKPIWITEMGWATHRVEWPKQDDGMLRGAFKALGLTGRKELRVLAVEQSHPGKTDRWFSDVWRQELPSGAKVVNCTYGDVVERLSPGKWDAVVMPFDESAPVHATDALAAYVRDGGCLVDFGGVPGYFGFLKDTSGAVAAGPNGNEDYRKALRIESVFKASKTSVAANGFDTGVDGVKSYPGWRGFGVKYLKEGDTMKPMMVGETGVAVAALYVFNSDYKGKIFAAGRSLGMVGCATSERTQAAMTVRSAMTALHLGIERYFVYEFQSTEKSPTDQESHFGLLHRDYTPKPAFYAYKTLIGLWPEGSRKIETGKWDDNGIYRVAWQRPDGTRVVAVWTDADGEKVQCDRSGKTYLDMFGRPVKDSNGYIEVGADPIYVIGGNGGGGDGEKGM